eukprot:GILK01008485.1.p1 GENE.GILK01008485.1~~GILK01008485.1.p1  ORF type:complete len:901 (-),score=189.09 GILK01008485.1:63-2714(-)
MADSDDDGMQLNIFVPPSKPTMAKPNNDAMSISAPLLKPTNDTRRDPRPTTRPATAKAVPSNPPTQAASRTNVLFRRVRTAPKQANTASALPDTEMSEAVRNKRKRSDSIPSPAAAPAAAAAPEPQPAVKKRILPASEGGHPVPSPVAAPTPSVPAKKRTMAAASRRGRDAIPAANTASAPTTASTADTAKPLAKPLAKSPAKKPVAPAQAQAKPQNRKQVQKLNQQQQPQSKSTITLKSAETKNIGVHESVPGSLLKSVVEHQITSTDIFSSTTFKDLGISDRFAAVLNQSGFEKATGIQHAAIPPLLAGRDVMVKAETGSGKTLAYLIPMIEHLVGVTPRISREQGTYAVILAPTRELSIQIYEILEKLLKGFVYIVPGIVMGGEKKKSEKARLRKGVSVLVATPGRLLDHLNNSKSFDVRPLRFLILDEADRLLDLGFEKDIKQIIEFIDTRRQVKAPRQSILISATLREDIERLAAMSLNDPMKVGFELAEKAHKTRKDQMADYKAPKQLLQSYVTVPSKQKLIALTAFLRWKMNQAEKDAANHIKSIDSKIVVFLATCNSVDFHFALYQQLCWPSPSFIKGDNKKPNMDSNGFENGSDPEDEDDEEETPESKYAPKKKYRPFTYVSSDEPIISLPLFKLHGDMSQKERTSTYFDFCKAESGILFCTDVAARGLDLPVVDWIVQYDTPQEIVEYVHRVGRTARLGKQGRALMFLTPTEEEYIKVLEQHGLSLQSMDLNSIFARLRMASPEYMRKYRDAASYLQAHMGRVVKSDKGLFEKARSAFQSFVRSYSTHASDTKHIFHVKNLHLGHVAKSFALEEAPSHAGHRAAVTGQRKVESALTQRRKEEDEIRRKQNEKKMKNALMSKNMTAKMNAEFAY